MVSPLSESSSWRLGLLEQKARRNHRTLAHSSCIHCRRKSYFALLHQAPRLRTMAIASQRQERLLRKIERVAAGPAPRVSSPKSPKSVPSPGAAAEPANNPGLSRKRGSSNAEAAGSALPATSPKSPKSVPSPRAAAGSAPPVTLPKSPKSVPSLGVASEPANHPDLSRKRGSYSAEISSSNPDGPSKRPKLDSISKEEKPSAQKPSAKNNENKQPSPKNPPERSQSEPARRNSSVVRNQAANSWPASVGTPKTKGLENPGTFCYRRSTLQSLLCTPQFFHLLTKFHVGCQRSSACVVCKLRDLATAYQTTSRNNVDRELSALDSVIRKTGRQGDNKWTSNEPYKQEDAYLFFAYLVECVEKGSGISKDEFNALYKIKHSPTWTCKFCKKVHQNDGATPFAYSWELPIKSSLTAAIESQHTENDLEIRCDGGCKRNTRRTRTMRISSAPEVLSIHLKRFRMDFRGRRLSLGKDTKHVDIPETLDVAPWSVDTSKPILYRLQAVVAHAGNLNTGHYQAYIRTPSGWKCISDSHVSNIKLSDALGRDHSMTPYLLTYVRDHSGETSPQAQSSRKNSNASSASNKRRSF